MITMKAADVAKDWPHVLELIANSHEEVRITQGRKAIARLIPEPGTLGRRSFKPELAGQILGDVTAPLQSKRKLGWLKGGVIIHPDFNAPL